VGCAIQNILQFWQRQYRAAVAYVAPVVASAVAGGRRALVTFPAFAPPGAEVPTGPSAPAGAITRGCPGGWYWTLGLTGCRCVEPGSGLAPATQAQVIGCIGQAAWDALVAEGVEGETA
jgi:hypothetical protein